MGEYSVFYIPNEQDKFCGKEDEVAENFWKLGIFLQTTSGKIMKRQKKMRWVKFRIPKTTHEFSYSGMGLNDSDEHIVPYHVHDVKCPACNTEVFDEFHAADENLQDDEKSNLIDNTFECSSCGANSSLAEATVGAPGFSIAKFYLYVSDIFPDDDWEPSFKQTVESVLGPCKEIIAWDT